MKRMYKKVFTIIIIVALTFSFPAEVRGEEGENNRDQDSAAARLYKSAFEGEVEREEAKAILREVISKHPSSPWAADALWVLARIAETRGNSARAILWRRRLIEDFSNPRLQPFTTEQAPFRTSRLPGILYLVETSGQRYAHDGRAVYTFNPLPFTLHDELGQAYMKLGNYSLARRHFRLALQEIPPVEALENLIRERLESSGFASRLPKAEK